MEIFGLVFLGALVGVLALIPAGAIYVIVKVWWREGQASKAAAFVTWMVSAAALALYIFVIPHVASVPASTALAWVGASPDGFEVVHSETRAEGGFTALFIVAEGREGAVQAQAAQWGATPGGYFSPAGDYNGTRPDWFIGNCPGGVTYRSQDFDPVTMAWCPSRRQVTFFRMREGSFG